MNQPTEDRIKHLEEEQRQLKEEVRKLKEQQTEPIRIDRLEIDRGGTQEVLRETNKKLDEVQENTNITKIEMQGARADITSLKATQSDHGEIFIQHGQRLKSIEEKQDTHTEILGQIVNVSEGHTKRFDRIDTTIAEQGDKLDLILKLLQPKGE